MGFFFAYTVSKEVGVPIGLINVSKGNRTSQNAFCKTAYSMVVLLRPNPQ